MAFKAVLGLLGFVLALVRVGEQRVVVIVFKFVVIRIAGTSSGLG